MVRCPGSCDVPFEVGLRDATWGPPNAEFSRPAESATRSEPRRTEHQVKAGLARVGCNEMLGSCRSKPIPCDQAPIQAVVVSINLIHAQHVGPWPFGSALSGQKHPPRLFIGTRRETTIRLSEYRPSCPTPSATLSSGLQTCGLPGSPTSAAAVRTTRTQQPGRDRATLSSPSWERPKVIRSGDPARIMLSCVPPLSLPQPA